MMSQALVPILATLTGAGLSAAGTWAARRWARSHNFVDRPGGHKSHAHPVALGGGIAVTLAFIAPLSIAVLISQWVERFSPSWLPKQLARDLAAMQEKRWEAVGILLAALVLCVLGIIDDRRALRPGPKFMVQLAVAAGLVLGLDLRLLDHLGPWVSIPLSIVWILTLTNSINFLDNMDGLAAGVAIIAASVFALVAMSTGQIFIPACCWLLVGALAGFLPFNFHPASIYLGDAGSLVIGMLLSVLTIMTPYFHPDLGPQPMGVLSPLIVLAVPLYDTGSVLFLRWRLGVPLWTGDRRHFSHRLVRRGMGVRQAVIFIWVATLTTALPALLLPGTRDWTLAGGILLQTLLVILLVTLMESAGGDPDAP